MGLKIAEVTKKLGVKQFTKLCSEVDKVSGVGTHFDIISINQVGSKTSVLVVTDKRKTFKVTLNG